MPVLNLSYVGIDAADLPAWERYAHHVLKMGTQRIHEGELRLRMDDCAYRIVLRQSSRDDLAFVGFDVGNAQNLENLTGRIKRLGFGAEHGSAKRIADRGVIDMVVVSGPDDVEYELIYGPTLSPELPALPALPRSGFVTGERGFGHLAVFVEDLELSLRFFHEGLGFRLSDTIARPRGEQIITSYFLHCNSRHHTIALAPVPGSPRRLHHVMVEVNDIDDVGHALDAARAENATILAHLGRHTNDRMLSFYMATPSGFGLEYGWGAIAVDPASWTARHYRSGSIWGHGNL